MIQNGLVDEVQSIGVNGFSQTSQAAIGYKECISYLNGEMTLEEMIELIKKNSRHYAKRQFTWFKNKTNATIIHIDTKHFEKTIEEVYDFIIQFMKE